MIYFLTSPAN